MAFEYFFLFLVSVASEFDLFHSVKQRTTNVPGVVGRTDEQHIREVNGHIKVVIDKRLILIGVKNLQ